MSRSKSSRAAAPERAAGEVIETRPRETDGDGRILDGHGLPLSGPARIRALAGAPDPARPDAEPIAAPDDPPVDVPPADQPPAGQSEESE